MASEGSDDAVDRLYQMLKNESSLKVRIKPFEYPLKSLKDRRKRLVRDTKWVQSLYILDILNPRNITDTEKRAIVKFAKSVVQVHKAADEGYVEGSIRILAHLMNEEDLFDFIDEWLRKNETSISSLLYYLKYNVWVLKKIIHQLEENPNGYSAKFVDIFA